MVEADEYDRSFLWLYPTIAIVNNVEADHLECYDDEYEVLESAFVTFASRARRAILNGDDPGARAVAARVSCPRWTVGFAADADVRITDVTGGPEGSTATVTFPGGPVVSLVLGVPGEHNVRNAAAALAAVHALDADVVRAAAGLADFAGVGRRFEVVATVEGVTVVDDYAHHPTEVAATLAAARSRFPGRRLVAVFQPHLYSRTAQHGDALGRALATADIAVVTEIYPARETPLPGIHGGLVADAARRDNPNVIFVPDETDLAAQIGRMVQPGDVVLVLGAGSITLVARALPAVLAEAAA